jgi:hypothetical protein
MQISKGLGFSTATKGVEKKERRTKASRMKDRVMSSEAESGQQSVTAF